MNDWFLTDRWWKRAFLLAAAITKLSVSDVHHLIWLVMLMEASVTETDGQYLFSVFIRSVSGLWTPAATNFVFHYPHADIIGHVLRYISYCIYVQLSFFRDYNEEKDAEGHLWLLYSKGSELFQWDAIFRRFSLLLSCKIFCFLPHILVTFKELKPKISVQPPIPQKQRIVRALLRVIWTTFEKWCQISSWNSESQLLIVN